MIEPEFPCFKPKRLAWRFSPKRFMADTALQSSDLALRGAWLQILCILFQQKQLEMTLSREDWARLWRCSYKEAGRILRQLKELSEAATAEGKLPIASVTDNEGLITLSIPMPPVKVRKHKPKNVPVAPPVININDHAQRDERALAVRNGQIEHELIQRRRPEYKVGPFDVENLVADYIKRTKNEDPDNIFPYHFAAALTRHTWSEVHHEATTCGNWIKPWNFCGDTAPPEPRMWIM